MISMRRRKLNKKRVNPRPSRTQSTKDMLFEIYHATAEKLETWSVAGMGRKTGDLRQTSASDGSCPATFCSDEWLLAELARLDLTGQAMKMLAK
jgi:hypothetical protein